MSANLEYETLKFLLFFQIYINHLSLYGIFPSWTISTKYYFSNPIRTKSELFKCMYKNEQCWNTKSSRGWYSHRHSFCVYYEVSMHPQVTTSSSWVLSLLHLLTLIKRFVPTSFHIFPVPTFTICGRETMRLASARPVHVTCVFYMRDYVKYLS